MTLNTRNCFLLLGLTLLAFVSASAQDPVLPLDSVLQRVAQNNPMLQEYDYRARAMDAYAEGARSWMPPMVGAGVFMFPYPGQRPVEADNKGMIMFSAEQEIPNPARQRARERYLRSRAAIEQAGKEVTYNQLRAQVKAAYYQLIVLEKQMETLRENERIMGFMLKLAKIRYPYGQSRLGGIYEAEARLNQVQDMMVMTGHEIEEKMIQLNILMNRPKETTFRVDTLVTLPHHVPLAVDTASLGSLRSDVRQLDQSIASMRLNVQLERLERLPEFRVRFDHMSPMAGMMPRQFTAMGMVSIPIAPWASQMYKANTKAMNLEIQAMQKERESLLNEAQGMVRTMAVELHAKQEHVRNYRQKIIPALRKNYDTTLLAYEQNTAELGMVIDAWEALNMAQMEYLSRLEQLYTAAVNYERELEK
jgi:cobalt-zinc-cadmium efflux system outer membrane protein